MKKVLLFGSSGQMASEFKRLWISPTVSRSAPPFEVIQLARPHVDFLRPETVREKILEIKPDIVVNAAAYTAVDLAETERDAAMRINADSVGAIGEAAQKTDALVVHFSTDYVFDGTKTTPYLETDPTNPINYYGLTKLGGEQALAASKCSAYVFRVQWLYGEFGKNFYKTMVHLFQTREEVRVVNDQFGTPTNTKWVAEQVNSIINRADFREQAGLYHLAPEGVCSWYHFAKEIWQHETPKHPERVKCAKVTGIATTEYPTPAKRPHRGVFDKTKSQELLAVSKARWQDGLKF